MAGNIEALSNLLNSKKSVFWAHNIHVANYHSYRPPKYKKNTVGYYLKQRHGRKYVNVGFGFSNGTFTAYSVDNQRVTQGLKIYEPPERSSLNYIFHNADYANFFIPMYKIKDNSELGRKLSESMNFLHITSSFKEAWREDLFIGKIHLVDYDYLVYFRNTTSSEYFDFR
jgi:erythromycin esterase-like protein